MKIRPCYPLLISFFYLCLFEKMIGGYFRLGRYITLLQMDLIIAGIWEIVWYQRKRWLRLEKQDKERR